MNKEQKMKGKIYKSFISLTLFAACLTATACGGDSKPGASVSGTITQDPLTLEGFDEAYLPDKTKILQRSGSIDLVLDFEGSVKGWQALADEYERLHGGAVFVNINSDLSGDAYKKKLDLEAKNAYSSEWDIVQGNLISGNVGDYCVDMYSFINAENAYAGAENYAWIDVLEEQAYEMETVESNSTYIMNTEGINTAWFVNSVALRAAAEKGYKNASGKAEEPESWDDIVNLCKYMKEAGYKNPLGLSLDQASVQSNQFTWLVRVYGDYYYRDEYKNIIKDGVKYEYKPDDEDPERFINESTLSRSRLYSCILDDSESNKEYYVGPTSGKFKDFLSQLEKLKPYISNFNVTTSQEDMRNGFMTQSKGKESPQIMLDYLGQGLGFASSETADFKVDFFDYPAMTSEYISDNRIVRDVGGSGGWLSVLKKGDKAQTELSIDFIKFVMSPYGQTIYYNALQRENYYPRGLTLVKGEYVTIPESWKEFFRSDKITWNGLVDSNEFIRNLLRGFGGQTEGSSTLISLYQKFMSEGEKFGVNDFATNWYGKIVEIWEKWAPKQGWKLNETKSTIIDRSKELK